MNLMLQELFQDKNKLTTNCYQHIKAFMMKLKLYKNNLKTNNLTHFPLSSHFKSSRKNFSKYTIKVKKLHNAFEHKFVYLQKHEMIFNIFICPFNIEIESAPENLQLGLIDLQSSIDLKYMFESNNKLEFCQKYIQEDKFPNLKQLALRILAAMGTTNLFFRNWKL